MHITLEQCRTARAWLGWNQDELARTSGIGKSTIAHFERGTSQPQHATLVVLRQAFENTGRVDFDDSGLVLRAEPSSE